MADEISDSINLTLSNGSVSASLRESKTITQTTPRYSGGVQTIGTTHEAITIESDVATPGMAAFKNLGATNYIEIGVVVSATFYPVAKLKPGETAKFRLAGGVTLYAKANTAASDLQKLILAD